MELDKEFILYIIGQTWNDDFFCQECPYKKVWKEPRPYGSTIVMETLSECLLNNLDIGKCPGLIEYKESTEI